MKTCVTFLVAILAASRCVIADSETNQVMGQLGHTVGTPLVIEGRKVEPYKGYGFDVSRVNGQELTKPVRIRLANVAPPFNISTNVVCQFKGTEITFIIEPIVDPKTGVQLQQAASGRHFEFKITEVLSPSTLKTGEEKRSNPRLEPNSQ
jgi:hypothetical protein